MTKAKNIEEMTNKMIGLLGLVGHTRYQLKRIEWSLDHVDKTLKEINSEEIEPVRNTLLILTNAIHDVYKQLVEIETWGHEDE